MTNLIDMFYLCQELEGGGGEELELKYKNEGEQEGWEKGWSRG